MSYAVIGAGDTSWVLISAALVLIMTPGVAFFYGGMVRQKNVLSIMMQSFSSIMVVGILWAIVEYSLAFAPGNPIIGGLQWLGLRGVWFSPFSAYSPDIPQLAQMIFQAMFAVITPALIIGAFAERVRYGPLLLFIALWSLVVYAPVAHWVWGVDGWLHSMGMLDFAGGTVVHMAAGTAALASALVLRPRHGFNGSVIEPENVPLVVLGAALLWFGWFGFNAGSALAANGLAALAFTNTFLATAAAGLTWTIVTWIVRGKSSVLGAMAGLVAGLVAITPAAGFVNPMSSMAIGVGAGLVTYGAALLRVRMKLDDSLDVWAVHGMGGMWGAIATGIFADVDAVGLLYGGVHQFLVQLLGVAVVGVYVFVVSLVLFKVIDRAFGFTVARHEEVVGLDLSEHGETAYPEL
jgi:Amt family ammonium transporter